MGINSEEEQDIMQEREEKSEPLLDFALSINEPIERMLYNNPVVVTKDAKISNVVELFTTKDVGCVLVADSNDKLIGIFTERDLIRKIIGKGDAVLKEPVEKYMTANPDSLRISDPIAYALNRMAVGGFRHVPLINESGEPIGFIAIKNIVEHLVDYYSNEILNLPPSPHMKQVKREGG